jgi:osmotically-inducible protein OsmY
MRDTAPFLRLEPTMTALLEPREGTPSTEPQRQESVPSAAEAAEYQTDRRTASRVNAALRADPAVPGSVRAAIRNGQAILEGTTDRTDGRRAAERVAGAVDGVIDVLNLIGIRRSA